MIIQKIGQTKINWCYTNGVIKFRETLPLYACHYKGKIGVGKSVKEAINNSLT